jgi:hypothetical protein
MQKPSERIQEIYEGKYSFLRYPDSLDKLWLYVGTIVDYLDEQYELSISNPTMKKGTYPAKPLKAVAKKKVVAKKKK